jgi:hypothetical protein
MRSSGRAVFSLCPSEVTLCHSVSVFLVTQRNTEVSKSSTEVRLIPSEHFIISGYLSIFR